MNVELYERIWMWAAVVLILLFAGMVVWDRYGLWTVVAVLIVLAGFAYPIIHLLMQHRYESPPYQPF